MQVCARMFIFYAHDHAWHAHAVGTPAVSAIPQLARRWGRHLPVRTCACKHVRYACVRVLWILESGDVRVRQVGVHTAHTRTSGGTALGEPSTCTYICMQACKVCVCVCVRARSVKF